MFCLKTLVVLVFMWMPLDMHTPPVTTALPDGSRAVIFARPFRTIRPDTLQKPLRHGPGNWQRAQGVDLPSNSPDPNLIKRLWDVPKRVQSREALLWGGLIGVLIRASFISDAIVSHVFLRQSWFNSLIECRVPFLIVPLEGTKVAIPGGASFINSFGPPVIINVVSVQNSIL